MRKILLLLTVFISSYVAAQTLASPDSIHVNLITHEVSWDSCGIGEGNDFNILYRYIVAVKNGYGWYYVSQAYPFTTQSSMVDPYVVVEGNKDYFQKWCNELFYSKDYPKQNAPPKGSTFYYRYKIGSTYSAFIDYLQ
jgi:hypothetical protein